MESDAIVDINISEQISGLPRELLLLLCESMPHSAALCLSLSSSSLQTLIPPTFTSMKRLDFILESVTFGWPKLLSWVAGYTRHLGLLPLPTRSVFIDAVFTNPMSAQIRLQIFDWLNDLNSPVLSFPLDTILFQAITKVPEDELLRLLLLKRGARYSRLPIGAAMKNLSFPIDQYRRMLEENGEVIDKMFVVEAIQSGKVELVDLLLETFKIEHFEAEYIHAAATSGSAAMLDRVLAFPNPTNYPVFTSVLLPTLVYLPLDSLPEINPLLI